MSIQIILISVLVVGGFGAIIGLLLGFAEKRFAVETDEREALIREALPGNNCGGCGYPGCDGAAAAIVTGEAAVTVCPVGGPTVARQIGKIMGQKAVDSVKMIAFVRCGGDCEHTRSHYRYTGVESCAVMPFVPGGGPKYCSFGCMGYASCVKACRFDAIHIVNGIAVADRETCKACGACVKVCPNHLIELVPYEGGAYHVRCASGDKGRAVMDACDLGCIACGKCEKNCPSGAIKVTGNIARIDDSLCTGCGACKANCPRKCID